jgi:hypothetical protein
MGAVDMVACPAVDACSNQPVSSTLMRKLGGIDCGSILVNAEQQASVLARAGELSTALGRSMSKLEALWKLSNASTNATGAFGQIQGCFGDLTGQGTSLARQIQSAGTLLQNALRILEYVKMANKAVAALMCTPWSMPAARALATVTAATTMSWLAMVAQMAVTIGQAISAVQQATQSTGGTTAALGSALGGLDGMRMPATTPPTFPTDQSRSIYPTVPPYPTTPSYPSYPSVPSAPSYPTTLPAAAPPGPTGIPTVYESGWIPRGATPATSSPGGGGLTIDIADSNNDGKYEVRVNVPESQLDRDLKIHVDAKVGDQVVKGDFDIDR